MSLYPCKTSLAIVEEPPITVAQSKYPSELDDLFLSTWSVYNTCHCVLGVSAFTMFKIKLCLAASSVTTRNTRNVKQDDALYEAADSSSEKKNADRKLPRC